MASEDKFELDDLLIELKRKELVIEHPDIKIFHSFDSKYLDFYHNKIIEAKNFDNDESLDSLNSEYIKNYRTYLGFRYIHLGSLEITGGLTNPNSDITFCFDLSSIEKSKHLIFDHDSLFNLLLYGTDVNVKTLYKQKYSEIDEILIRKLDLKKANYILTASLDAQEKSKFLLPNVIRYDISEIKEKILKSKA